MEGTEVALKLSGLAAKNFALFVYAVLKDQKKTRGKTRLVRMLREQRPFKFFKVPVSYMKEFAREAKEHGLLYVPIRNRQKSERIEVVVFADDASKIQRIYDNLGLDYVAAQAGDATVEKAPVQEKQPPAAAAPSRMEPSRRSMVRWNLRWAASRMKSNSPPYRTRRKGQILLLAGRRTLCRGRRQRVRQRIPRPTEVLRPVQPAVSRRLSKSPP